MSVIHISEAEAARDFVGLLDRVRAGVEVVIENDASTAVVLHAANQSVRRLSASLRLAKEHGSTATLDDGFAHDLRAIVDNHPEPLSSVWG